MIAHPRRGAQPASSPVAASLANAPPAASPSSVMRRISRCISAPAFSAGAGNQREHQWDSPGVFPGRYRDHRWQSLLQAGE